MRYLLYYIEFVLTAILFIGVVLAMVYGVFALSGYNFYQQYTFENTGDESIESVLQVEVNASGLIDGGYIRPDAKDVELTYLGGTVPMTAMDLTSGSATWRFPWTVIPANSQVRYTQWFGGSGSVNYSRNQKWIASGSDTMSVINPGSFTRSGTESFTIRARVIPAVNPATRQYIFGLQDSYELTLEPGPMYRWHCSGSGAPTATATISATVGTLANLVAWHNGPGGEIVLCDTINHICGDDTISDLQSSGTMIAPITFDGIIDTLAFRVPDYPASGTPVAGGTPSVKPHYVLQSCCTYEARRLNNYPCGYKHLASGTDVCSTFTGWCNKNMSIDVSEPRMDGETSTHRYGLWPYSNKAARIGFIGLIDVGTITWSGTHVLNGVSVDVTIDKQFTQACYIGLGWHYDPDDPHMWETDPTAWYWWPEQYIGSSTGIISVNSGTRTLMPNGNNMTVERLNCAKFFVYVRPVVTYPGIHSPFCTLLTYPHAWVISYELYVDNPN